MEKDENGTSKDEGRRVITDRSSRVELTRVGRAMQRFHGAVGGLAAAGIVGLVAAFVLDARRSAIAAGAILVGTLVGALAGRLFRRWW
jgi:hypothetical protein